MGQIQLNWKRKGLGVQLLSTSETRLKNLRFADDLISLVHSLSHVSTMIEDLCLAARQIGLELHPKKTVILHNAHCNKRTGGTQDLFHDESWRELHGFSVQVMRSAAHSLTLF